MAHNRLLRLGNDLYLEVIAPNLAAPAPGRPRWFGLTRAGGGCAAAAGSLGAAQRGHPGGDGRRQRTLGTVEPMTRGAFEWLITIPPDGLQSLGAWRRP
jgi:hypothetical protein